MGTGSFPGVNCGWGVTLTPHPLLEPRSKIESSYTSTLLKCLYGLWKGETYLFRISIWTVAYRTVIVSEKRMICHNMKANTANIHDSSSHFQNIHNKTLRYGRYLLQKPVKISEIKWGQCFHPNTEAGTFRNALLFWMLWQLKKSVNVGDITHVKLMPKTQLTVKPSVLKLNQSELHIT
jgi:hypothetical protein